ncbi:MAG: hypothetical protein B9S32_09185 [Verrucomicrobia bacterium Tous-C9LFEB]|nr:MAG: hypothetical protein B9S32_09185 [Verrucomicrobia bacterium Tous-C9LFEB]
MIKLSLIAVIVVIAGIVIPEKACSAVLLSLDGTAMPTTHVLTSFSTGTIGGYVWKNDSNMTPVRRDVGQSFYTADSITLESFGLQLNGNIQGGDPGAEFTVSIYQSSALNSIGTLLTSETGIFPTSGMAAGTGSGQWLNFNLTDLTLQGQYYYTLMLTWTTPAVNRNLVFSAVTAGGYASGSVWSSADGSSFAQQGSDYYFYVQGVTVPEPSSTALLMGAGMVLIAGLRLRNQRS